MPFAPICIFAFNRPESLRRLLESLAGCDGFESSPVYIFLDGPRKNRPGDSAKTAAVAEIAHSLRHQNVVIHTSSENRGLAASVRSGVSQCLSQHGNVIVLEDDLILAPTSLTYFNEALRAYKSDFRVKQISGFSFPATPNASEAYFLPFISTWGWATWEDRWQACTWNADRGLELLERFESLRLRFNLDGAYDYTRLMRLQVRGRIDSWGILWNWHVFSTDGLVLYPPESFVENQGIGLGTHGWRAPSHRRDVHGLRRPQPRLPKLVALDAESYGHVTQGLRKMNSVGQVLRGGLDWVIRKALRRA